MGMAKLYWTGDVGYFNSETGEGITPARVKADLSEAGGTDIEVELSTFGGNFFDGVAIMDLLKAYKGKKKGYGSSVVASAGTVISLGLKPFLVRKTTMFMVHNAQGWSTGDHNKMREDADLYERMSDLVAEAYSLRTGKTVKEMKALMDKETWLMGQEIVDMGFADGLIEDDEDMDSPSLALLSAQKQFRDRVTMWAKPKADPTAEVKASIESLIDSWAIDKTSPIPAVNETALCIDKNPVAINGKVYRSSLRSISARAAKDEPELAKWATAMIAKIDAKGDLKVNKEAVLAWLKDNPGCASEVAATMGLNLVTDAVTKAVEMKAKLEAANVADPLALIATMKADLEKVETARIEAAMSVFGPKVSPSGAKNKSREFAELALRGVKSDEIEAKIEEVKKNEVFLALRGELFDVNSDWNLIGVLETDGNRKPTEPAVSMGAKVRVV